MNRTNSKTKNIFKGYSGMTLFMALIALFFVVIASSVTITNVTRQRAAAQEAVEKEQQEIKQETEIRILAEQKAFNKERFFSDISIRGRGAIVYDINSDEVLYEKNADEPLALASITKVMTVITARDLLPEAAAITIDQRALNTEGESGLLLGETWNFRELSDLALIASSNDATTAIADSAGRRLQQRNDTSENAYDLFIKEMNTKAHQIGMESASFINASGLDINNETVPSALASARDVAKLFSYATIEYPNIMNHSRFGSRSFVSLNGRNFEAENTNDLTREISGLLASKTGYTLQAGGNLAVVADIGFMKPVVIVVLGSTRELRTEDVKTLHKATQSYFESL